MESILNKYIINKGFFNNIDIMENSLESIKETFDKKFPLRCTLQYLKDGNFIIFDENSLQKIFNLKDSLKTLYYDDLEYISKYQIPKLIDLLNILKSNTLILVVPNLSKKTLKNLINDLKKFQNNIIIESKYLKILKLFKKNEFKTSLLITKKNKHLINNYFKTDIYNIEIGLFDNKIIKKIREKHYVIGNTITNKEELEKSKDIYDNLVIEG